MLLKVKLGWLYDGIEQRAPTVIRVSGPLLCFRRLPTVELRGGQAGLTCMAGELIVVTEELTRSFVGLCPRRRLQLPSHLGRLTISGNGGSW